ncbi:hypothetical protein GOBAR_DD22352 [Gossypium barbadense]|nr:hypothetical protein GOBAR_DD22352 [Gossypium barbadense]
MENIKMLFSSALLGKNWYLILLGVLMHADQQKLGYLGRQEFYNALKLVPVAQNKLPTLQSNLATLGTPGLGNVGVNHQHLQSQQNQVMRPTQAVPSIISSQTEQVLEAQGMLMGGNIVVPRLPTSNSSINWQSRNSGGLIGGANNQVHSQVKATSLAAASPATSSTVSMTSIPVPGPRTSLKPRPTDYLLISYGHPTSKLNQQVTVQSNAASGSTGFLAGPGNLASRESTQSQPPWPKITQSDVQKYTKVFVQVDTDRDGKITAQCNSLCHPVTDLRTSHNENSFPNLAADWLIAPPKPKVSQVQKETAAGANTCKILNTSERIHEKDLPNEQREDSLEESPSGSPAISSTEDKRSQEFQDSYVTNSSDNMFKGKSSSIFADSVPSTPAYAGNMFKGKNSAIFAESIPSSPVYADKLFKGQTSSIFADSVPENGLFQFSSLDIGYGYDWFDAQHSLARFGSTRSSRGFDHGHELPLFDDTDPFRSTGPFKTSVESQSPREDSDKRSAFQ